MGNRARRRAAPPGTSCETGMDPNRCRPCCDAKASNVLSMRLFSVKHSIPSHLFTTAAASAFEGLNCRHTNARPPRRTDCTVASPVVARSAFP
jgi:hypothetical protein